MLTEKRQRRAEGGKNVVSLTSTNPTSDNITPQAVAMEHYCFTTSSSDVKSLEMETFSYHLPLKTNIS